MMFFNNVTKCNVRKLPQSTPRHPDKGMHEVTSSTTTDDDLRARTSQSYSGTRVGWPTRRIGSDLVL